MSNQIEKLNILRIRERLLTFMSTYFRVDTVLI